MRNEYYSECAFQQQCNLCICSECPCDCAQCQETTDVTPRGAGCLYEETEGSDERQTTAGSD